MQLIEYLLRIFDVEEGYKSLEACKEISKPGCKGLCVGVNDVMLDLMDLSVAI